METSLPLFSKQLTKRLKIHVSVLRSERMDTVQQSANLVLGIHCKYHFRYMALSNTRKKFINVNSVLATNRGVSTYFMEIKVNRVYILTIIYLNQKAVIIEN